MVGLFSPPLLAATAVGAGMGAVIGHLTRKHGEKMLGVDLEEYLPPNSSAVVVVLDDTYLDGVQHALGKASRSSDKAIDNDDCEALQKALAEGSDEVSDAVGS